jgi:hypothetical protein
MSLLWVGSAFWVETRNRICLQLSPAGQKIIEKTLTDHFLYRFNGEDGWPFHCIITEPFFDEGLRVDRLGDPDGLWNVDAVEVVVEELRIYSQIRFFNHFNNRNKLVNQYKAS